MNCPTNEHESPPSRRDDGPTDDHSQPLHFEKDWKWEVHLSVEQFGKVVKWITIILCVAMLSPVLLSALSFVCDIPALEDIFQNILSIGGQLVMPFFITLFAIIILAIIIKNVRIVPQANAYVIERLGKYHATWDAGLHIKIPVLDRIALKTTLKEQVLDFEPQAVITKDNVSMKIDTVVYLHVVDARLLAYGVEHALPAIENLTATTLRNIIGELTLDDALTSRDTINGKMQSILDEATDPWGIKVNRVELKNILPPRDIQEAMEKQMRAEREKREAILRAEGSKQAAILEATGAKEATILQAEASKQKMILEAEADRQAAVVRAEGEAEAIRKVKEAEAKGISMIKEAAPDDGVVRLRSLSALESMAKGQATTIIVPSDLAGLAGTLAGLKATLASEPSDEDPDLTGI